MSDYPFTLVEKSERKSPLKQKKPTRCDHPKAYTSDKYPAAGTRYICTECGHGSTFPRDLAE
jgi:hypothetical protein